MAATLNAEEHKKEKTPPTEWIDVIQEEQEWLNTLAYLCPEEFEQLRKLSGLTEPQQSTAQSKNMSRV